MTEPPLVEFDNDSRLLSVKWPNEDRSQFPYIWLRHGFFFPAIGRPEQKDDAPHIPIENVTLAQIADVEVNSHRIVVYWGHDSSQSQHDLNELRERCLGQRAQLLRYPRPVLWDAEKAHAFVRFDVSDLDSPESRLRVFRTLRDFGIAFVRNVATKPGTLHEIARYFGPVRKTHFGELFDIRSLPPDRAGTGANIGATSSNAQAPHTDEGWRHGPPGISLFHCLEPHPSGGESLFVDGFSAADRLRQSSPQGFSVLANTPLLFAAERNALERFRTKARVISLDSDHVVRGVRISDRTLPPPDLPIEQIEPVYTALRQFREALFDKDLEFECHLQAGDLAIFDNHRILHARRAFDSATGSRWMQQLSVDREEFHNTFRQLIDQLGDEELRLWQPDAGTLSFQG
ncbi:MAG: TauD/TfdA family dioxygenase [Pseudomonadota bacterium]